MLDIEFVRAVHTLREKQGFAPTTGDVAAQMGITVQYAARRLKAIGDVFSVPANPAPRWHVRSSLGAAEARIYALVVEAGELARGLDAESSAKLRAELLDALEGRR